MASLTIEQNGRARVGIETPDGKRHTIRLGVMPRRTAEEYRDNIAHLRANWQTPHLIAPRVLEWVNGLDAKIHRRLANTGLVPARDDTAATVGLKQFLDEVFATLQVKESTRVFYGHTRRCLLAFFGDNADVAAIDAKQADAFHAWLATNEFDDRKLSPATVSRRMLLTRHTFAKAIRWGYRDDNPFAGIRVGRQVNASRKVYVPRDTVLQALGATSDPQFRLMLALSRFGGLRCPSEHLALTWADVDWEGSRITVRSSKTEGHAGGEARVIPLFGELHPYLREVFEQAEPGAVHVITAWRSPDKNLRTRLLRTLARCGIKPWPKLFHNLRASCETDLARQFPLGTVAEWLGHNPAIMVTNYLTNPDLNADFQRAAEVGKKKATRNPTRTEGNSEVIGGALVGAGSEKTPVNGANPALAGVNDWAIQDSNDASNIEVSGGNSNSDAQTDAHAANVRWLVGVWPSLSLQTKAAIIACAQKDIENKDGVVIPASTKRKSTHSGKDSYGHA